MPLGATYMAPDPVVGHLPHPSQLASVSVTVYGVTAIICEAAGLSVVRERENNAYAFISENAPLQPVGGVAYVLRSLWMSGVAHCQLSREPDIDAVAQGALIRFDLDAT